MKFEGSRLNRGPPKPLLTLSIKESKGILTVPEKERWKSTNLQTQTDT